MVADHKEHLPAYWWVVMGALTSGGAMALITMFIFGLLLPDISREFGLSPSQQGWLGASAVFGNMILGIPMNEWLSRYRPWRLLAVFYLGVSLLILLQGWAPTLAFLIAGRIGLGIFLVATQAPRALIIQQWTPTSRLPFAQGVFFGVTSGVWGMALFITPLLLEALGSWRDVFYIMGCLTLLCAFMWSILGKERVTTEYQDKMESQVKNPLLNALKYKQLWLLFVGMVSGSSCLVSFEVFWPTFAQESLDVSLRIAGFTSGIALLTAGPASILVNALPALARRQTLVMAVSGIALAGTSVALLYIDSIPVLIMVGVVRGLANVYFPAFTIMAYLLPGMRPREVVAALSVVSTAAMTGAAIGPLLVGFIQEATGDLRFGLYTTAFMPVLGVLSVAIIHLRWLRVTTPTRS